MKRIQVASREKEYEYGYEGIVGLWGEVNWEVRLTKAVWDQIINSHVPIWPSFLRKPLYF